MHRQTKCCKLSRSTDRDDPKGSCVSVDHDRLSLLRKYLKRDPQIVRPRHKLNVGNWLSVSRVNLQTRNSNLRAWGFCQCQTSYWFDWDREILSHDCCDKLKLDWRTDTTVMRGWTLRKKGEKKIIPGTQPKARAGWPKRLMLVQATPWADFAVLDVQLCSTKTAIFPWMDNFAIIHYLDSRITAKYSKCKTYQNVRPVNIWQ